MPAAGTRPVAVDDDVCTIVCGSKEIIRPNSDITDRPAYPISVTNKSGYTLEVGPDYSVSFGKVNGIELSSFVIEGSDGSLLLGGPAVPPGETADFYLIPNGGGYSFTSLEELVNVELIIKVDWRDSADELHSRDYTLFLDMAESPEYHVPSDVIRYENELFSDELPSDWVGTVIGEGTADEYAVFWAPPQLASREGGVEIQLNPFMTYQELSEQLVEIYSDPEDTLTTCTSFIGGHPARVIAGYNDASCTMDFEYYVDRGNGDEIRIFFSSEPQFEPQMGPIRERFLNSIAFRYD